MTHTPGITQALSALRASGCDADADRIDSALSASAEPVGLQSLRRVGHELRAYDPIADEYRGKHIHKIWACEIDAAIGNANSFVPVERLGRDAAVQAEPPASVPDGYAVVPAKMYVSPEQWDAAQFAFGGPGSNAGEPFYACTLWIGEIENDDGSKTHGLHVSCDECPEEGSITLSEFASPPTTPEPRT